MSDDHDALKAAQELRRDMERMSASLSRSRGKDTTRLCPVCSRPMDRHEVNGRVYWSCRVCSPV